MTINSRIRLIVIGPTLFWSIPGFLLALTTYDCVALLLPFMGFYPGQFGGSGPLFAVWGCFSLLGFAAVAFYAFRKSSQAIAFTFAMLLSLSSLTAFVRLFWCLQNVQ
jgi:hypothetical protein